MNELPQSQNNINDQKQNGINKWRLFVYVSIVILVSLIFDHRSLFSWEGWVYVAGIIAITFFLYKNYGQPGYQEKNKWKYVNKKRFWILFIIAAILFAIVIVGTIKFGPVRQ